MVSIGCNGNHFRFLFVVISLLGLFWLHLLIVVASQTDIKNTPVMTTPEREESLVTTGEWKRGKAKLSDGFNMSKRRTPNGPDPIHNRRASNSRRPPGQA